MNANSEIPPSEAERRGDTQCQYSFEWIFFVTCFLFISFDNLLRQISRIGERKNSPFPR